MKMIRFLGDGRNLQHRRRVPATIRMSLRLLLLVCAMLASVPQGNAFTCFASADLVRQENPGAWPTWTLRAPGREGTKCWYASTRAMATDHRNLFLPRTDGVGANEQSKRQVEVTQSEAPVATIRAASPDLGSSFEDRFSAVLEGTIPGERANIQQLMELFRSRVRGL
jgi:hypothetical protein